jgi:hypothetical protein
MFSIKKREILTYLFRRLVSKSQKQANTFKPPHNPVFATVVFKFLFLLKAANPSVFHWHKVYIT